MKAPWTLVRLMTVQATRRKHVILPFNSSEQPKIVMEADKLNALLATSFNLHVGPHIGGAAMTPAKARYLRHAARVALAHLLREKGGSDLYSKSDADKAFVTLLT